MDPNEVGIAFEILLEEVESVVEDLNEEGAEAFRRSDYVVAREIANRVQEVTAFRDRVKEMQREWNRLFGEFVEGIKKRGKRQLLAQRLQRGLRTPEDAFRRPILEALVELGGSSTVDRVLDLVYEKMKDRLNEYDLQPLTSMPEQVRWRNTAQWCRYTMVREGLLKPDSPRGVWEITEAGRKQLIEKEND